MMEIQAKTAIQNLQDELLDRADTLPNWFFNRANSLLRTARLYFQESYFQSAYEEAFHGLDILRSV